MKYYWVYTSLVILLSVAVTVAQTGQCTDTIERALQITQEACEGIERNQACFGHIELDATSQPDADNFEFSDIGDTESIAAFESLTLTGFNAETGAWGIALMQIQANLPSTLPGQNVTVILFGDTMMLNNATSVVEQIPPEQVQTISATNVVNVRRLPILTSTILGGIDPNTNITATGRTADNEWLRVSYNDQIGWIATFLLESEEDIADLLVVEPDAQEFGPMRAFYLSTGIGRPDCNEVPDDGMLVQTPAGTGTVDLLINEVEVEMGSTVYFHIVDDRILQIQPIEGAARASWNGQQITAVAGTLIEIPLDENFSAMSEPSEPESYLGDENIELLPVNLLERDIEIEDGLEVQQFDLFRDYEVVFENINIEDVYDVFNYINAFDFENDIIDLPAYLIDALNYTDFGEALETYFESEGYDLRNYPTYTGDDYDYYESDSDEANNDSGQSNTNNNGTNDTETGNSGDASSSSGSTETTNSSTTTSSEATTTPESDGEESEGSEGSEED